MKKWALTVVLLLTLGVATGMASTIDFSTCAPGDITASLGIDCGGVNFFYAFDGATGANTAVIGSGGVVVDAGSDPGGLEGVLVLTFPTSLSMAFDFVIGPQAALAANDFGLLVILNNPSVDFIATDATGVGTVAFQPASNPFTIANVTPNPDASSFTMSSLSFTTAVEAVPEPGTYALFGSGLLMLGFGSRKPIKRRS